MPIRIQRYEPAIQEHGLDAPRRKLAPAASFGMDVADGLTRASSVMDQLRDEADQTRAQDAVNKFLPQVNDLENKTLMVKGENVFKQGDNQDKPLGAHANGNFDAIMAVASEGLANDRQREYFKRASDRLKLMFSDKVGKHEAVEIQNWQIGVHDSSIAYGLDRVGNDVKNGAVSEASMLMNLGMIRDAVQRKAKLLGWDATQTDLTEKELFSQAHSQVLNGFIKADDYSGATAWLEKNKAEINEKTYAHYQPLIKEGRDYALANERVSQVMGQGGTLEEQTAAIRSLYSPEDKKGADEAMRELRDRWQVHEASARQAKDVSLGKLWDMRFPTMPGQKSLSFQQIMRTQEWASIDGEERNKLRHSWEQYAKRNASEGDGYGDLAQISAYLQIRDNPRQLASMSDMEIISKTPVIGEKLVKKLLFDKREAGGDVAKLSSGNVSGIEFEDLAAEYGITTKGKKGEDLAKAQGELNRLRMDALESISSEQMRVGSTLSTLEKDKVIRDRLKTYKVNKPGVLWGTNPTDVPLYKLDSSTRDAYGLDITPEEREKAVALLLKNGKAIKPSTIAPLVDAMRKLKGAK